MHIVSDFEFNFQKNIHLISPNYEVAGRDIHSKTVRDLITKRFKVHHLKRTLTNGSEAGTQDRFS